MTYNQAILLLTYISLVFFAGPAVTAGIYLWWMSKPRHLDSAKRFREKHPTWTLDGLRHSW